MGLGYSIVSCLESSTLVDNIKLPRRLIVSGEEIKKSNSDSAASGHSRRAPILNLGGALKYILNLSTGDKIKQRFSDYVTIVLVIVCVAALVGAVALPLSPQLKLIPLLLTVMAVVFYIVNRLGIIISLNARQAMIIWQILVASFWLGVTSAMLVMMSCFYFLTQAGQ
jgi:hypothetical protein